MRVLGGPGVPGHAWTVMYVRWVLARLGLSLRRHWLRVQWQAVNVLLLLGAPHIADSTRGKVAGLGKALAAGPGLVHTGL